MVVKEFASAPSITSLNAVGSAAKLGTEHEPQERHGQDHGDGRHQRHEGGDQARDADRVQGGGADVGGAHAVAEDDDPDRGRDLDQDLAQPLRAEIEAERLLAEPPAHDPEPDPAEQDQEEHGDPELGAVAQHAADQCGLEQQCPGAVRRGSATADRAAAARCAPSSTQIAAGSSSRPSSPEADRAARA